MARHGPPLLLRVCRERRLAVAVPVLVAASAVAAAAARTALPRPSAATTAPGLARHARGRALRRTVRHVLGRDARHNLGAAVCAAPLLPPRRDGAPLHVHAPRAFRGWRRRPVRHVPTRPRRRLVHGARRLGLLTRAAAVAAATRLPAAPRWRLGAARRLPQQLAAVLGECGYGGRGSWLLCSLAWQGRRADRTSWQVCGGEGHRRPLALLAQPLAASRSASRPASRPASPCLTLCSPSPRLGLPSLHPSCRLDLASLLTRMGF